MAIKMSGTFTNRFDGQTIHISSSKDVTGLKFIRFAARSFKSTAIRARHEEILDWLKESSIESSQYCFSTECTMYVIDSDPYTGDMNFKISPHGIAFRDSQLETIFRIKFSHFKLHELTSDEVN